MKATTTKEHTATEIRSARTVTLTQKPAQSDSGRLQLIEVKRNPACARRSRVCLLFISSESAFDGT